MRAIELFAGIGGFRVGLERAGHKVVWANEWDKYASDVYDKNFGAPGHYVDRRDLRTIDATDVPAHDLIVGGFPCQAFSIAGKRQGLEDSRGTLFVEIARIAAHHRTPYLFLENVRGLLNHDEGRTFGTILRTLDELGYDCQWQVLNSKHWVPQNRERVFIVGSLRTQACPEVFPLPSGSPAAEELPRRSGVCWVGDLAGVKPSQSSKVYCVAGVSPTLDTGRAARIWTGHAYRHITPRECERLQGFSDGWTAVGRRPDGTEYAMSHFQRYKQLGNAVTVDVVEAIARRLP